MVKELKAGAGKVRQITEVIYSILVTVGLTAGVVNLATQPYVQTGAGKLPVWQVVAAVLATVLVCKLWKLHNNEH